MKKILKWEKGLLVSYVVISLRFLWGFYLKYFACDGTIKRVHAAIWTQLLSDHFAQYCIIRQHVRQAAIPVRAVPERWKRYPPDKPLSRRQLGLFCSHLSTGQRFIPGVALSSIRMDEAWPSLLSPLSFYYLCKQKYLHFPTGTQQRERDFCKQPYEEVSDLCSQQVLFYRSLGLYCRGTALSA